MNTAINSSKLFEVLVLGEDLSKQKYFIEVLEPTNMQRKVKEIIPGDLLFAWFLAVDSLNCCCSRSYNETSSFKIVITLFKL